MSFPRGLFFKTLRKFCGEANEEGAVVGLHLCIVGSAVAVDFTAFGAAVIDDKSMLGIRLGADGLHLTAAGIGAVTGVDINVKRPETEGAMIARGKAERQDLFVTVRADEAAVVFGEPFLLHETSANEKVT